jgi:hypothetical protein
MSPIAQAEAFHEVVRTNHEYGFVGVAIEKQPER